MTVFEIFRALRRTFFAGTVICVGSMQTSGIAQAQEHKLTLMLPLTAIYALPYFAAEDLGIFKEEGLAVEFKVVNGDQNAMRAMLSGSGEVATGIGPPILFELAGRGGKVKVIDSPMRVTDYFLIMGKGKGSALKDLAGKRVAISTPGSMPHLLPQMMLKKNGIDPAKAGISFVAIGGMSARLQAIVADKVDASIVDTQATLVGQKDVTVITSTAEQFPEGLAYGYSIVTEDALKNPKTRMALVALGRSVIRASRAIMEDPDRAAIILHERFKKSVDLDILKAVVRQLNAQKVWNTGQGVEKSVYDFTLQSYLAANTIPKAVPYDAAVDPLIGAEALKSLR